MSQLTWLPKHHFAFPPVEQALTEPNGLLAVGGDLSPRRLVEAYRRGIFPWYEAGQPILWWSPDPRLILRPDHIHVSRSLRKLLRQDRFQVTADTAFDRVIQACAWIRQDTQGTWITDEMMAAYRELHRLGFAHSIETWRQNRLVGGLYGVSIGRAFFGESMFSRENNASKVALVRLCEQLSRWGFGFIDCQVETGHLVSMGAERISRDTFQQLLATYADLADNSHRQPWTLETGHWRNSPRMRHD